MTILKSNWRYKHFIAQPVRTGRITDCSGLRFEHFPVTHDQAWTTRRAKCPAMRALTFVLRPTVDDCNERTTKKGRRKGSKGKNDDNWRYCVQNCLYSGKSPNELIQCHLCQSWIHPDCVGEDGKGIVGIWTCTSCRQLPVLEARLVEKTSALETLIDKLACSNQKTRRPRRGAAARPAKAK